MDGGIFGLLGLIAAHRGAVEYDLRSRFNLGLRDVGERISLAETARLIQICAADPESAVTAALNDWKHTISREALILGDLFDVTVRAAGGKDVPPHSSRPFDVVAAANITRHGDTAGRTSAEVTAILDRFKRGEGTVHDHD